MTGIGQANFLQALGWAVLNSLWQMALLWVVYQLITGIYKNARSSAKSTLATVLLLTGFSWFLFTFTSILLNESAGSDTVLSSSIAIPGGDSRLNNWLDQMLPIASGVYLLLLLLPLVRFIRNYRYVQIIRTHGLSKVNVQWKMFVKKVAVQMDIKKNVRIWVSELVSSPVTIGFLKPIILVPMAAINHLSPQQLEAILLHELSHIKRYDFLINLAINFIQTILYFNPFVKAFVKIVEREREKSCDEMVIQFQYDPHSYASALLVLEKTHHTSKPLAVAASGKKNDLLHRVELILGIQKKNVFSFNKLAGLFAGLLCVIALNALLILSKPVPGNNIAASFDHLVSPFYLFSDEENNAPRTSNEKVIAKENNNLPIVNHAPVGEARLASIQPMVQPTAGTKLLPPAELMPGFINANFDLAIKMAAPQLKDYQLQQVKDAIEDSRKVIKDVQWKAVESDIADVLTEKEKEKLQQSYQTAIDHLDWKQWENKLQDAYNKVDWERINLQLKTAVNQIRLDSLQTVYNMAASKLDEVQQALSANDMKGIPDTDITLQEVENKKKIIEKSIITLKGLRTRKIVHL